MTAVEIGALSANEIKQKEKECMEKNVGQVAQEVTSMVHDEPGPAGNFVKCYVTTCEKNLFYFIRHYPMQYTDRCQEMPDPRLLIQENIFVY